MKKLRNMQIFSKLVVTTPITTICLLMRNFITNFVRILGICKDFAGNRVNELGITAEAFGFDSENFLFHRLRNECKGKTLHHGA